MAYLNESLKCKPAKGEMKGHLQKSPSVLYCLWLFTWFLCIDIRSRDTVVRKFILIPEVFPFWAYEGVFTQHGVRKAGAEAFFVEVDLCFHPWILEKLFYN